MIRKKYTKDCLNRFPLRLHTVFKASLLTCGVLLSVASHAVISPWAQERKDISIAIGFIEKHPLILHGLKRIESPAPGKVRVLYEFQPKNGEIKTCYALFTPSLFRLMLPKQTVSYTSSTCPIFYEDD